MKWIEEVRNRTAIADVPEKANEQHYEVRTILYVFVIRLQATHWHEVRFRQSLSFPLLDPMGNTRPACIQLDEKHLQRRRNSCLRAIV